MKKTFFVACWLLAGSVFAQNHPQLEKAVKAYESKKYAEALTHLDKVVGENPEDFAALYYRAMSNYHSGRYEQAVTDLTKCIELQPTKADLYYYRGLAKQALNKKDDAYNDFTGATLLDTANGDFFYKKALLALDQKDYVAAAVDFDNALRFSASATDVAEQRKKAFAQLTKADIDALLETNPLTIAAAGVENKPVPDDQNTIAEKKFLEETKFKSIDEARAYYEKLSTKTGFAAGKKAVLLALARQKALKDVYGDAPFKEDLEDMYNLINRERWLNPDGLKYYFKLIEHSPNYFSGGLDKGGSYYYYKVTRSKRRSDYDLAIYQVKNKLSNLVYSSTLEAQQDSASFRVKVFQAENKGYMWKKMPSDYLEVEQSLTQKAELSYKVIGAMEGKKDSSHGLSSTKYKAFTQTQDQNSVAVMKAALNTLVLDYSTRLFANK